MKDLNLEVSYFPSIKTITPRTTKTMNEIATIIQSEKYKDQCEKIGQLKKAHLADPENKAKENKYKELKKTLPYFTASGVFRKRNNASLILHNGAAQIDLDGKDNVGKSLDEMREVLENDPHVFLVFMSPSRDGMKGLCRVPVSAATHKASCEAMQAYYKEKGFIADKVSDVSRACFMSSDPNIKSPRRFIDAKEYKPQEYGLKVDEACKNVSRALYLSSDKDIFTRPLDKVKAFQPKEVEVAEPKPARQYQLPTRTQSYGNSMTADEEAEIALSHLDPDLTYPDWRTIGAGCHDKGASFSVWDSWCSKGTKYNPIVAADEWGRFKAGKGTKFGTVIEMAKQANGGVDPVNEKRERVMLTASDFSDLTKIDVDAPAPSTERKIEFFRPSDLSFDELEDDDLVENLLGQNVLSCIYAPPESGKTFVALDIAASVANGTPWHGRDVVQCTVIYIGLEGKNGVRRRLKAMKREGIINDETPIITSPSNLDLSDNDCVGDWICAIASQCDNIKLVIIDTLMRATASDDISNSKDMSQAVGHATLIGDVIGCSVLLVHHSGKDPKKKELGSTALRASLDTSIFVKRDDAGVIEVSPDKQKDMAKGAEMNLNFTLETVCIGSTKKGKLITSCVLREAEASDSGEQKQKQKESDMLDMIDSLNEAVTLQGGTVTTTEWDALSKEDLGIKAWRVSSYRKELLERGDVLRSQDGRTFYWKVNPAKFEDVVISKSA